MPKKRKIEPMSKDEFQQARRMLGVSVYALAPILGVSLRHAQRYESGEAEVPPTVAKLLRAYLLHGLPN